MSSLFTVVTVVVFIYLILCVVKGPRVVVIEVVGEELVSYTSILMTTFVFMTIPVTASVFITTSVVKKNQKQKKKGKKRVQAIRKCGFEFAACVPCHQTECFN